MLFPISETYEIVTPESAEIGEFAEADFNFENNPMSFREVVEYLTENGFIHASSSIIDARTWATTEAQQDYANGNWESRSLHCHIRNARMARYWIKALKMADIR